MPTEVAVGQTSHRPRNLVLLSALLLAPLVALPLAARALVDSAAHALANIGVETLDRALAWRTIEPSTPALEDPPFEIVTSVPEVASEEVRAPSRDTTRSDKRHQGIVVRAAAVARAVQSGVRPSSTPAPATNNRPAGLALVGVNGYGTGLRDGDVVTRVGGTDATSESAVISAVAGALAHGAKRIGGVIWRGDQRIDVLVEIPTFKRRRRKSAQ